MRKTKLEQPSELDYAMLHLDRNVDHGSLSVMADVDMSETVV